MAKPDKPADPTEPGTPATARLLPPQTFPPGTQYEMLPKGNPRVIVLRDYPGALASRELQIDGGQIFRITNIIHLLFSDFDDRLATKLGFGSANAARNQLKGLFAGSTDATEILCLEVVPV